MQAFNERECQGAGDRMGRLSISTLPVNSISAAALTVSRGYYLC